ncbi:hypothetical protein CBM2589_U20030 [Cupriavidus taiwanensis]|uniref:Uncharacterized protein n=1 Tax=Cupriavidus taiwanensis TaxID=164546 RepID=A0A375CRB3_9BURK|nr:hypothetical protein [Cupriavidus taiwanensis]SOY77964.1 hypothetical protein CBM2589_U20030 [Cupriavidus taiwanensis]
MNINDSGLIILFTAYIAIADVLPMPISVSMMLAASILAVVEAGLND